MQRKEILTRLAPDFRASSRGCLGSSNGRHRRPDTDGSRNSDIKLREIREKRKGDPLREGFTCCSIPLILASSFANLAVRLEWCFPPACGQLGLGHILSVCAPKRSAGGEGALFATVVESFDRPFDGFDKLTAGKLRAVLRIRP